MSGSEVASAPGETPDLYEAFPLLSQGQSDALDAYGQRRRTEADAVLFREGDPHSDLFVILAGEVAIVEGYGVDERVTRLSGGLDERIDSDVVVHD